MNYPAAPTLEQGEAATFLMPKPAGGTAVTYTINSGALPPGMTLDPATGQLGGAATQPGVFSFVVQATNTASVVSQPVTITVLPSVPLGLVYPTPRIFPSGAPISLQAPALTNATPGIATVYSVTTSTAVTSLARAAAGRTGADRAGGTLPAGLVLNADGSITGTPTLPGYYTFTVMATNGTRSASASAAYTVTPAAALTVIYDDGQIFTQGTAIATQSPTLSQQTPGVTDTFAVTAGSLPAGLTLNADGTITGIPTTPGVSTFTITVSDANRQATSSISMVVTSASSMTLGYTLPLVATAGSAISTQAPVLTQATPGVPTTYAVTSGSLPAGLTLNADGTVTGVPAVPGVYSFTITATNGSLTASTGPVTIIEIPSTPMTLAYPAPQTVTAGTAVVPEAPALTSATPGLNATYTISAGHLPQGMTMDSAGVISGTPTTPGVYAWTVTAANGVQTASDPMTVTVVPAGSLTLNYNLPATLTQGTDAGVQVPAVGNATPGVPATYAVTSGSLPVGITLNADGTLSGTPTMPGVYPFAITLTDGTRSATSTLVQTVVSATPLALSYPAIGTLTQGTDSGVQSPVLVNATPGVPVTYAVTGGALPPGLSLNADGTLTGTPSTPGLFTWTITATNGTLSAAWGGTCTVISSLPLTVTYPSPAVFTGGSGLVLAAPTVANATPGIPVTYSVTSGTLPAGLTLNPDGTITGTPTTPGVSTFTVTVTNGTLTASTATTITVVPSQPLALSYPTPVTLYLGTAAGTQTPTVTNATPGVATAFAVSGGSLPTGLVLNPDGTITGTPTVLGTFTPTILATNGTRTASATVAYTVASAAPTALNYTSPVTYTAGYPIGNNTPSPTGGAPTSYAVTSGTLPAGLSLNSSTGVITGTPTAAVNAAAVTIRGTNSQGGANQTLTLTVLGTPTAALTSNPSVVTVGQSSSLTALLSNGTGVISGGNLASPVAVADGVSIPTGIVNAPTSYTYTLTVTSPQGYVVSSTAQVQWIAAPVNSYTTPLSSSGGTYTPPSGNPLYGEVTVTVPAQSASCGASTLTVNTEATLPGSIPAGIQAYSETFNLTTDVGYPFRTPMTVTLAYTPALGTPALAANDMPMAFYWDPTYSAWVTTGVKAVDTVNHTVTFTTLQPGRYAILAAPGLASALATENLGFTAGTDDWLQNNLDIYDLPNGASLGMGSYAAWYFKFAKPSRGTGLYKLFTSASDPNALALISRVANGTLEEWAAVWHQSTYGLTGTQTGLGLVTGLMVTGQPQLFLMADERPAVNNALATLVTSYNAGTGAFGVVDPNYPGNPLTITWTPGTGAFSNYDRALAYSPALAQFALEGQTSIHRLADYETVMNGAASGYPAGTYASIAVTGIGATASPDLSQAVSVASATNVTVTGTVTNGDQAETSLYWSQNLEAPRTSVALTPVDSTHSSFSFTIPTLANPYGTQVMLETTSNPCDPTFSHSGFQSFTVAQSGLSAWFPNACFENSTLSPAPWVNQEGSNSGVNYPNPTSYSANTFSAAGALNGYSIGWSTASTYSGVVNSPTHANDVNMGSINPIASVLDGDNSFRVDSQLTGSHISQVSQTITVPTTISYPKLSFYWSFLAQSAGHAPNQEPFVDIVVYDLTTHEVLYYVHHFPPTTYSGVNYTDGYPGWVNGTGSGSSQWFGINWQKVTLNLGTTRGNDQILVSVTAAGCTQGGHAGYAYLDSIGCN